MTRVAIMQPYFLPYIGYFQLIAAVDLFIVYDNIKYTKKGWINRNRILQDDRDAMISLPLKGDADALHIRERELAADFDAHRLARQITGAYRQAPGFGETFPLVERILGCADRNLFGFLHHSIVKTCRHLGLRTEIAISSAFAIDHGLKAQDKVLALCQAAGATSYVNAIGGTELYSQGAFREKGIGLRFLRSRPFEYQQFGKAFVPWLSILDVMMFNSRDAVATATRNNFDLV